MYNLMTRKPKLSLTFFPILALLVFFTIVAPQRKHQPKTTSDFVSRPPLKLHIEKHIQAVTTTSTCDGTLYPDLCVSTLSTILSNKASAPPLPDIISAAVHITIAEVLASKSNCSDLRRHLLNNLGPLPSVALTDCLELFDDTVSQLKAAIKDLSSKSVKPNKAFHELETLFSAAMTNQATCLDGFSHGQGETVRRVIQNRLMNISHHISNSLVLLNKLNGSSNTSSERRLGLEDEVGGFPGWITRNDRRRLLQEATKFDLVVAKDGSGDFKTVGEAVAAAPNSTTKRFVIHIKAGAYFENVEVASKKTMLMFVGEGIGKTVIKASRSVGTNWTTFRSATVAVVGNGFLAKNLTIENTAGPSNHQAVALRSGSDLSAFYLCSFVGYQDTLYVHSQRQFYRNCEVYGTVDFVFGNAAAVLQNCNLYARKPNPNQKNLFTAQGREDPNQNTGISLLNCKIAAASDLIPVQSTFKSYLGRPWKEYSRTVVLLSQIDDLIDPAGWLEWSGDFALDTLFYGEYMNRGGGANTSGRVTWQGYRVVTNSTEAGLFTAGSFLQGAEWLPNTSFPYYLGLS